MAAISTVCVSYTGLTHAREQLARAKQLQIDVHSLESRSYTGSWLMVLVLGAFGILPGILWWFVNRRPNYLIQRDRMLDLRIIEASEAAKSESFQGQVREFFDSHFWGWLTGLFCMVTIGVLLSPVSIVLAYKRNYIDPKTEP